MVAACHLGRPVLRCSVPGLARVPLRSYGWKNDIISINSLAKLTARRNLTSTALRWQNADLDTTRNIGIIAHIDAGKTTTTERMLYYSGFTRRIGEVDEGSTVTDFLPAERARGITIQSAAITFHWPPQGAAQSLPLDELEAKGLPRSMVPHTINLIDTPGHADFTFEVLRSLRILDGAVCILDGVAGVEAQTEKVWHQADTYQIPRIVYVNKLDRDGAAFGRTVREVGSKLRVWPAVCQIPWFEGGTGRFKGVADVVALRGLFWEEGGDGKVVQMVDLPTLESQEPRLASELKRARTALVELLSEHDEDMVDKFLQCDEDHLAVSSTDILRSLRKCLLDPNVNIVPVFAGASFRNIGVQPLLDAVNNLLPSPTETADPEVRIGNVTGGLRSLLRGDLTVEQDPKPVSNKPTKQKKKASVTDARDAISSLQSCALAFKVVSDARRGVLVYVRVYSGTLHKNSLLYNTNLHVSERAPRLFRMYANDAVEVDSIPAGHIGVVTGLKHARTGDTLISYAGNRQTPPEPLGTLQLRPIDVPPPVFFASLEPHSLSEEKPMMDAVSLLLREDPSLHVTVDEDSGQTLLSGMGELHLEIARDRLVNDLKAKASMGRIEIGYRECALSASNPVTRTFDKDIAGRKGKASCTAMVEPFDEAAATSEFEDTIFVATHDGNQIVIRAPGLEIKRDRHGHESAPSLPAHLDLATLRTALYNGSLAALSRGPGFSFPMHSTRVTLTLDATQHIFGAETNQSALSAAARLATQAALHDLVSSSRSEGTALMEPVMNVVISVDEASLGAVVHDISSARGGHIVSLDEDGPSSSVEEDTSGVDVSKIYAPPDPFETPSSGVPTAGTTTNNPPRTITAKVPLKEMVGYLKHLRSLTAGRGTFVMSIDRFERMSPQRQRAVLAEMSNF
ncbi:hypothetical protein VTN49DRAFT_1342 [Thermomyces lanuginosus]|uniref:uncharacterized protein n=1 Tax=Thermomyces lanuginosus TaxID=5541 RepID=UPI003742DA84